MGSFYSRLSYSFGNEDWKTEQKALQIQPTDRVVCVTASGDRPLNLLTNELQEIVAVDANPLQNALFDLKRVALSELPHAEYLKFMGVDSSKERGKLYSQIEKGLDPMVSALWGQLPKKIERGVLYEGATEKFLKVVSGAIRLFRGKKIDKLFSIDNLEEQHKFVKKHWHTFMWKKLFQVGLHPLITRTFIKDPGLYEHIDPSMRHIGNHLYSRIDNYLNHSLAKQSVLLSLILTGKVDRNHFPPYLSKEGIEKIKKQIHKTSFHTIDLVSFIEKAEPSSFDCFSISDVASYLNKEHFNRLVEGIFRSAKPGARFCMRQFLSNHQLPAHLAPHFKRNSALEQELQNEDCCFVYRFMTGTIEK
ncbi:MAG: hypothetical protein S4CHLAM123_02850 [Chlamydiales bacterium]|nr:hypothetical protein [Chlamydiales bacterium]